MIHIIIVHDPVVFGLIKQQTEAKKVPLLHLSYEVFSHGNIRIVGKYSISIEELLTSLKEEFNPDTVFFLSKSYPVSDEKQGGDIILPNVFFRFNQDIETMEIEKDTDISFLSNPIFLEHYSLQGDYDFESFGLSVGGIHVSGLWNEKLEDFRIRLRVVYENDTFDAELFYFVEAAQKLFILEKAYPVAYIETDNISSGAKNLWSIVGFIIGSIDADLISSEEEIEKGTEEEEEWVDGKENE